MFICCSRFLSPILLPIVYHGQVPLPLLLGNEQVIWSVSHVNVSLKCPSLLWHMILPDSPQEPAAALPEITLSH
jgi:hypothetical protein